MAQPESEEKAPEPGQAVATFKGRLQLDSFAYRAPGLQSPPRRSPRLAASPAKAAVTNVPSRPAPAAVSSSPAPRRVAAKRKSAAPDKSPAEGPEPVAAAAAATTTTVAVKKKKRSRTSSGYAPPSKYAHLPGIPDALGPDLLVLFIGLNPGIQTAVTGHAYAHPSNLFWKLLHSSGVVPRFCRAEEDRQMPALYHLGLTNIVGRPSRNGAELSRQEMDDGVAALEDKARRWRPECMCVVGKSIWESVWRVRHGGQAVGKAFRYGWQDPEENMGVVPGEWAGARVFVASSTSGLAATLSPAEKQSIWNELGVWVKARRAERERESGQLTQTQQTQAQQTQSTARYWQDKPEAPS